MKKYYYSMLLFILILVTGCANQEKKENNQVQQATEESIEKNTEEMTETVNNEITYEAITQEEAKELMDTTTNCVILDVRTKEEFATGHIKGAICIANETIDESIEQTLTDKQQLILVYCRSGNRSRQAAEKLVRLGYTNIKEFGGINTWPYETE